MFFILFLKITLQIRCTSEHIVTYGALKHFNCMIYLEKKKNRQSRLRLHESITYIYCLKHLQLVN